MPLMTPLDTSSVHPQIMAGHILIIDDDPNALEALSAMVRTRLPQIAVEVCDSSRAAWERIRHADFDAIVSDIKMPDMDGFELMEQVLAARPGMPTLLMTGHGDRDVGAKALAAGAYAFISKPIDRDYFIAWLTRAIQLRQLNRCVEQQPERKRAEDAVRDRERFLEIVTGAARVGLVVVGPGYVYRFANAAYAEVLGLSVENINGRHVYDLLPDGWAQIQPRLDRAFAGERVSYELVLPSVSFDGPQRYYDVTYEPHVEADGQRTVVVVVVDISGRKQAEEALRRGEATIRLFIEQAPTSIAMLDRDMRYVVTSRRWIEHYGRGHADLVGRSHYDVHPDLPERWKEVHRRCLAGAVEKREADRWETADGTNKWLHWEVRPWLNTAGEIGGIIILAEDITAQREAQRAVVESERKFRATFENAAVGISHVGLDGRWLKVNDRLCEITGYSREELLSGTFEDITHPDDVESDWSQARRLIAGDIQTYSMDKRYFHKNGGIVWITLTVSLVRDEIGRPQHFISVIQDITDRKHAEEAREKLVRIVEHSHDFIATADLTGRITYMNAGARRMIGFEEGRDPSTLRFTDYVPPDWQDFFRDVVIATAREQGIWEGEMQLVHLATGERIDVFRTTFLIRDPLRGEALGYATVTRDITKHKRAEAAIRNSEQLLRLSQQAARIGSFEWNIQTGVNTWTPELESLYGLQPGTFGRTQHSWEDLLHPDDRDEALRRVQQTLDSGLPGGAEWRVVWPDGTIHWLAGRWQVFHDDSGKPLRFTGVNIDITDRKQAEEESWRTTALFRTVIENTTDLIYVKDRDSRIMLANPATLAVLGLPLEAVLGKNDTEYYENVDEARAIVANDRRIIETGRPLSTEEVFTGPQGRRVYSTIKSPLRNEQGEIVGIIGVSRDITERQQTEQQVRQLLQEAEQRTLDLRNKQEQLVQAAKLASIGELASGVAHELNNPLNNIGLFIGNAIDRLAGSDEEPVVHVRNNLEKAKGQVHRAAAIINHLRTFARTSTTPFQPVAIHDIVRAAVSLVETQLRVQSVDLKLDFCAENPSVVGNAIQLEQVFINLLTNAADALKKSVEKTVVIASRIDGECVELSVRDTGDGIHTDLQARIFDPFFTTKDVGKGTGLGLSISYGIIKDHQGTITLESEVGKGTTFLIRLPTAS